MRRATMSVMVCIGVVSVGGVAIGHPRTSGQAVVSSPAPADGLVLTGRVGGPIGDAVADGRRVYASVDLRLRTLDLADPDAPRLIATSPMDNGRAVPLPGNLDPMVLDGNRLYGLLDWDRQVTVDERTMLQFVVLARSSDLAPWSLAGTLDLPTYTAGHFGQWVGLDMVVDGDRAYVAAWYDDGGPIVAIVDVADATAPRLAGRLDLGAANVGTAGLAAAGDYVYLAEWSNDATTGLQVLDVTDAAAPRQVAEVETVGQIMDIVVADGSAFVIGCGGLQVLDLADPALPRPLGPAIPFPPAGVPPTPGPGPTPTPEPGGTSPMQCYYWFDAEWRDGYLYAMTSMQTGLMSGSSFLWRIDVRDPAKPAILGALEVPDGGESLSLGDGIAVVGGGSHKVIDQAVPDLPRVAADLSKPWRIGYVVAADGNLAVRDQAYGFEGAIEFIDLSDEHLPRRAGAVPLSGTVSARDLVLRGHVAYAALREHGVLVVDAADPWVPRLVATVPPIADVSALDVEGTTAYLAEADSDGGAAGALRVFDVHDPARPAELGRLAGDFGTVAASGGFVYVGAANDGRVEVVDARDPAEPLRVAELPVDGNPRQLAVDGDRLLALTSVNLYVINVNDPTSPRPLGRLELSAERRWRAGPTGRGMAVRGDVVYLASYDALQVVDVHDGTAPRRVSVRQVPSIVSGGADIRAPGGGDVAVAGHTLLFAGDGTGLWTFGAGTPDGMTEVFEGVYRVNFESSDFAPDYAAWPEDETWWWYLVPTDEFRARYEAIRPDCARGTGADCCDVWTRFEGRVTPPTAGVTWYRSRSVTVTRLVDMWPMSACPGSARDVAALYLPHAGSASD